MHFNAMPKVHTLNVILQCTTLDRFCDAIQCNATCYLFTEHGKELVLVCNAMQSKTCNAIQCKKVIAYMLFFNAPRSNNRLCNAMQHVISLMNMGRS